MLVYLLGFYSRALPSAKFVGIEAKFAVGGCEICLGDIVDVFNNVDRALGPVRRTEGSCTDCRIGKATLERCHPEAEGFRPRRDASTGRKQVRKLFPRLEQE